MDRAFVRTILTAWTPNDYNVLSLVNNRLDGWKIPRLNQIAFVQDVLVDSVNILLLQSFYGKKRTPVPLFDSQYDISTTAVVNVIGKGTYAMQNGYWIPVGLVSILVDSTTRCSMSSFMLTGNAIICFSYYSLTLKLGP